MLPVRTERSCAIREWCIEYLARDAEIPTTDVEPDIRLCPGPGRFRQRHHFIVASKSGSGSELVPELAFDYPTSVSSPVTGGAILTQSQAVPSFSSMVSCCATVRGSKQIAVAYTICRIRQRGGDPNLRANWRSGLALADRLASAAKPGDRRWLLCPPGDWISWSFLQLSPGRIIAVPMMIPRRNSARDAADSIVADCARVRLNHCQRAQGARAISSNARAGGARLDRARRRG